MSLVSRLFQRSFPQNRRLINSSQLATHVSIQPVSQTVVKMSVLDENYILPLNVNDLSEVIKKKWDNGTFVEDIPSIYLPKIPHGIELEAWECMMLYKICAIHENLGELIVAFPPEGSPSELMKHIHGGGRVITTLAGNGTFGCQRDGKWNNYSCKPGTRIMFPPNTPHTFTGDGTAMLVHALHTPYFDHNDPRAMTYLHSGDNGESIHSIEYPKWDPKEYFPHILK